MKVKYVHKIGLLLLVGMTGWSTVVCGQQEGTRKLRLAFHIFNDDGGSGNFQPDSQSHMDFLGALTDWINHKMVNLDTLKPAVESVFIPSMDLQIVVDSIFFHNDTYAWDCSDSLDSEYMRVHYVDRDTSLSYQERHQTLPVFFGDNYSIVGGHVSKIGSKRLIAMRGIYTMYNKMGFEQTVYECGRNIFHELGHALGLNHNFTGGPSGEQCDECEDNGCPPEGTSNNLMDYWPGYGGGISACQLDIINTHLVGLSGTISDVVINDSCNIISQTSLLISGHYIIDREKYLHQSVVVDSGGVLEIRNRVSVPHQTGIRIKPGGKIILDGGVLTNLCGDLWKGISGSAAQSEALIEVILKNGARIEHAETGISLYGNSMIRIEQAEFLDCITAVQLTNCRTDTSFCLGTQFQASRRYHRSEEGAALGSFIHLENSSLQISNCYFVHKDQYFSRAPDQTGTGIVGISSKILSSGNVFQFLTNGIVCMDPLGIGEAHITDCQFVFCLTAIQNVSNHYLRIEDNTFEINRFSGLKSTGIFSLRPGWMQIDRNHFFSAYGGENLVGIYHQGSRGKTQMVSKNQFTLLHYGIVEQFSEESLHWPTDLEGPESGLVLDENQYIETDYHYMAGTPEGYGLAYAHRPRLQDPSRFEAALHWPLGGLSIFHHGNTMLTQNGSEPASSAYPQNNFWINVYSDQHPVQDEPVMTPEEAERYTDFSAIPLVSPDFPTNNWIESLSQYESQPQALRNSTLISQKFPDLISWPYWAFKSFVELAGMSVQSDQSLSNLVRVKASRELNSFLTDSARSSDQEALPAYVKGLLPDQIETPEIILPQIIFNPGVPLPNPGSIVSYRIFPNPAVDQLWVLPDKSFMIQIESNLTYRIFDQMGRIVDERRITDIRSLIVPLAHLSQGAFVLHISDDKTFYGAQKFIILRQN